MGVPLEGFGDKVRETAAEGMVLLKNEKQMFPLTKEDHVAIFGRCQINYYKSGTGSGGAGTYSLYHQSGGGSAPL